MVNDFIRSLSFVLNTLKCCCSVVAGTTAFCLQRNVFTVDYLHFVRVKGTEEHPQLVYRHRGGICGDGA